MVSRVVVVVALLIGPVGRVGAAPGDGGDPDPACTRMRAEASAEAALLYAPRVELQGARAPELATADDPTAPLGGFQARVSVVLSPVDLLRGRAVERAAVAECRRTASTADLERLLAIGPRYGELAAARAEVDYLERHLGDVDALVNEAAARFASQRATALEVDDLRERRARLRIRIADRRYELELHAQLEGDAPPPGAIAQLVPGYRAAVLDADRRRADVRALSAWQLELRAGLAGADRADWFAVVELGYSLGRPWQAAADRRAARARADELAHDDRDVSVRLERLQRAMQRSVESLAVELRMIDDELVIVRAERARIEALAGGASDAARQLGARYTVEVIELEARRTGAAALIEARRQFLGGAS
jgi:hypothetical protein